MYLHPPATSVAGGLLLVFSSHDILNTRDDALSAPPSGRIVLPFAPKDLRSSFITFLLSDANTDEALKKGV